MKSITILSSLVTAIVLFQLCACTNEPFPEAASVAKDEKQQQAMSKKAFISTVKRHLHAVSNRDLTTLKSTMSPDGEMQLILPGAEILNTVDSFMVFHENWFQDTVWTFETKILNTTVGKNMGIAITEVIYREPERDGKPYFNRMIVSYALKKDENQWFIIKDHASSVEKSTGQ